MRARSMSLAFASIILVLSIVLASSLHAQVLTSTPAGVVVAHHGRIDLAGRWNVAGVDNPTFVTADAEHVAVLDALANQAVIVELKTGRGTRLTTAETPIAAIFHRGEPVILARDARVLQRGPQRVALSADPAFLRAANDRLYVYCRTAGILEEIAGDRVTRRLNVPPFASDFEVSGNTAYLTYPRDARVRTFDLQAMKAVGEIAVGAVPVDLAFAGGGTALSARILAVADPSSKRVWLTESTQSTAKAVGRGFLRGVLGLGLFGNRNSQFPTGVDRVEVRGKTWIAYDSSTGTLYHFDRRKSSVVTKGVPPGAWAATEESLVWWNGTSVAEKRLQ
jgi:hypothetical protein